LTDKSDLDLAGLGLLCDLSPVVLWKFRSFLAVWPSLCISLYKCYADVPWILQIYRSFKP